MFTDIIYYNIYMFKYITVLTDRLDIKVSTEYNVER